MRWAKDGPRIGWYLVPITKSAGLLLFEIVKDTWGIMILFALDWCLPQTWASVLTCACRSEELELDISKNPWNSLTAGGTCSNRINRNQQSFGCWALWASTSGEMTKLSKPSTRLRNTGTGSLISSYFQLSPFVSVLCSAKAQLPFLCKFQSPSMNIEIHSAIQTCSKTKRILLAFTNKVCDPGFLDGASRCLEVCHQRHCQQHARGTPNEPCISTKQTVQFESPLDFLNMKIHRHRRPNIEDILTETHLCDDAWLCWDSLSLSLKVELPTPSKTCDWTLRCWPEEGHCHEDDNGVPHSMMRRLNTKQLQVWRTTCMKFPKEHHTTNCLPFFRFGSHRETSQEPNIFISWSDSTNFTFQGSTHEPHAA